MLPAGQRRAVLEIGCGSGQHGAYFAEHLPHLTWIPSDPEADHRASAGAWAEQADLTNVLPAIHLDAARGPWPVERADIVYCANVIHISPWSVTEGLLAGVGRLLDPGGALILYGPFKLAGRHTAPSNARFDASLTGRDPSWGVRDLDVVSALAATHGLTLEERVQMPANNQTVVFRRG